MISNSQIFKRKILIPFVIAMVVLIGAFIFGLNYFLQVEIGIRTEGKVKSVSDDFAIQQYHDIELMSSTIVALQHDSELQKYWLARDRDKLLEKSLSLFNDIRQRVDITHFYFHDASAINFLRVHNPQKYGDLINRFTMRDSKELLTNSSGIEVGAQGTFTLRVVSPWFIDGELVGFIELGEEIEHITKQICRTVNVDLVLLYKKEFTTKEKYENGQRILNRNENWTQFNEWAIIYKTQDWIPEKIEKHSTDNFVKLKLENNEFPYLNKSYIVKSMIIRDAGQREVAVMLIFIDSTVQFKVIRNLSYMISGISFVVGLILFLIFYIVLSKIEKNLKESQNRISQEVTKREHIQKAHLNELEKEKEKLLESEGRFNTIVTHSSPIIFMFDKNGIIQLSEGRMLDNIGLKPGEVVGQNVFELYKDYPEAISVLRKTLSGEIFEGVIKISGRFLESFYSPNIDSAGNIIGVLGIALDITSRKEAEDKINKQTEDLERTNAELGKSRMAALSIMQDANMQKSITEKALSDLEASTHESKKLSHAIEQAPVTVVITDLKGTIEYVNPNFTKVTGYSAEEAIGKNPRILKSGNLEPIIYSEMWETLASNKVWRGELENRKKNGEIYWESVSISPINNSNGETTHFVAVKEDITLQRDIKNELIKAKTTAEVATETKSRFLASMSHEIRTPMNAIIGLTYLTLNTTLDRKQLDYLTKIDSSAKSLLKIINDILDFSKIEAGELTIEEINYNLEDVITSVTNLIYQRVYEKGLELIGHISPNVPLSLIGDPLRLGQILTNFCNNAVKFTDKGEIVIEITLVAEDEERAELEFAIKDTGIGIREDQKDRLFKAFQQADTTTTREFGGTGLGLVITENLAKLMKGDIWFESEENVGSTFYFSMKVKKQKTQRVNQNLLVEELTEMRVLLCDNNITTNKFLYEVLESFSFRVDSANSQEEVRILLENSGDDPYKLVITDCRELVMENIGTLGLIKNMYNIPILMLISPFLQESITETEVIEIVSSFLLKPYNYSDFFNTIMELFGKTGERNIVIADKGNQYQEALEKIRGSVILLAEDNEINQQLIVEMFESVDIQVEVAENGIEAVEMFNNSGLPSKYSLVLMDIQMPEMNGFEATSKIQKLENYKSLPIIAMTADAMAEVKEKCISVGMVDFLSKPIEPEKVLATLVKWIEPSKEVGNTELVSSQNIKRLDASKIVVPHIDGVNRDDALRYVGGDKRLFTNLLEKFLNNADFEIKMKKALEENDREKVIRLIHTLKGNAGLLGMNELKEITSKAQNALLDDKNLDVENFLSEISYKLMPIITSLKILFATKEGSAKLDLKFVDEVEEKLDELKVHLELHDMEAVNLIKDIGSIIGFESEIIELNKSIASYQFDKALEILENIKS